MEKWKDIAGYEGLYQISNMGRVKSLERFKPNGQIVPEKIKTPSAKSNNYLALQLYKNNKPKNCYIHRLVAEAFIPNPQNKETVNHINGDKHDNSVENLEWSTYTENNHHATQTGLNGTEHMRNKKGSMRILQYDENMNLIAEYPSMREAERQTGIDCASISLGVRKGWKYGGFIWETA